MGAGRNFGLHRSASGPSSRAPASSRTGWPAIPSWSQLRPSTPTGRRPRSGPAARKGSSASTRRSAAPRCTRSRAPCRAFCSTAAGREEN
ncbi:unnamed protein product, partial [Heterosigma akashiwo]